MQDAEYEEFANRDFESKREFMPKVFEDVEIDARRLGLFELATVCQDLVRILRDPGASRKMYIQCMARALKHRQMGPQVNKLKAFRSREKED